MPPKDKRYAVYILFLAFGLFAYIPMGFFNTATDVSTYLIVNKKYVVFVH